MNIKQVKERFTIESLLKQLGFEPDPKKSKGHDLWYCSPLRPQEKEPSFHISTRFDIWKDFGELEQGGDLIRFGQMYLKSQYKDHSVSATLKWFESLRGPSKHHTFKRMIQSKGKDDSPYKLLTVKPIYSAVLFQYLTKRQIPHDLAQKYLRQVFFLHKKSKKRIFGLGIQTRAGGYDVRNPHGFKTMIGNKDITFVAGTGNTNTVDVFEGVFDFLSQLTIDNTNTSQNDCIITNSVNLYRQAADFIKEGTYTEALLWSDNDYAGKQFEKVFSDEFTHFSDRFFRIAVMGHLYPHHKDLNAWLTSQSITFGKKKQLLRSEPMWLNPSPDILFEL